VLLNTICQYFLPYPTQLTGRGQENKDFTSNHENRQRQSAHVPVLMRARIIMLVEKSLCHKPWQTAPCLPCLLKFSQWWLCWNISHVEYSLLQVSLECVPVCLNQVQQQTVNGSVPSQVKSKWTKVACGPQSTIVLGPVNSFICCCCDVLVCQVIWLKLQTRSVQHKLVTALI